MKYSRIIEGKFLKRPNRFTAEVEMNGELQICHVKNTGRCRELLVPGASIYLEESINPARKTKYDLVSVRKGDMLINMDSQAPNRAVGEWLASGGLYQNISLLKAEQKYGNSRFDFYMEAGEHKIFVEVKGVTLEENGLALFPDAPTERGVKHIRELCECMKQGYEAIILFVIQMRPVKGFAPNDRTQPLFGEVLRSAAAQGVKVLAYDCEIKEDSMEIGQPVPVLLE